MFELIGWIAFLVPVAGLVPLWNAYRLRTAANLSVWWLTLPGVALVALIVFRAWLLAIIPTAPANDILRLARWGSRISEVALAAAIIVLLVLATPPNDRQDHRLDWRIWRYWRDRNDVVSVSESETGRREGVR